MYEERGDPQPLPQECTVAGALATPSGDAIDLGRKRKSATTHDEGNVSSVISTRFCGHTYKHNNYHALMHTWNNTCAWYMHELALVV